MAEISSNNDTAGKILGIDYGATDVGLALADLETRMAFAYRTLHNDKDLVQKIAEIVAEERVEKIIIGVPTHVNREVKEYPGERFGKLLMEALHVEIEYQDEMFTTKMAQRNLIERKVKQVSKHDDEEAARIILQEWLDNHET